MGKVFADAGGRKWEVGISVSTLGRVKSLAGINLLDVVDRGSTLLDDLANDPISLCNVLFAIVKPQADALGVTDEQFGEALLGDSIADATDALIQAIIDFFPKARRSLLQKAFDRAKKIQAGREAEAEGKIGEILDTVEASLSRRSDLSGKAPESAESILPG
jgi:hypothetical protein